MREVVHRMTDDEVKAATRTFAWSEVARSAHPMLSPKECADIIEDDFKWIRNFYSRLDLEDDEGYMVDLTQGVVYVDKAE